MQLPKPQIEFSRAKIAFTVSISLQLRYRLTLRKSCYINNMFVLQLQNFIKTAIQGLFKQVLSLQDVIVAS